MTEMNGKQEDTNQMSFINLQTVVANVELEIEMAAITAITKALNPAFANLLKEKIAKTQNEEANIKEIEDHNTGHTAEMLQRLLSIFFKHKPEIAASLAHLFRQNDKAPADYYEDIE